ncbi:MAG: hypothetical protein QXO16_06985 [Archaeoglobaceae archaeon]
MIIARHEPLQTLEDHVSACLKAFESLRRGKFWKLFGEKVEKELRIAIVLHDSGKIFYQTKKNFLGHELFSTYISHVFTKYLDLDSRLVEATILYHHYAMGLKKRIERFKSKFGEFKVCEKSEEFERILEGHESIVLKYIGLERSVAKEAMESVKESIRNHLNGCKLRYGGILQILEEENKEIWMTFVGEKDFRRSMLFCINMMTLVDYAGVVKTEERGFGGIVEEFLRIYAPLSRL